MFLGLCHQDGRIEISLKRPGKVCGDISYSIIRGAPKIYVSDWREAYVSILAHEVAHAWQYAELDIDPSSWRGEIDAEGWALVTLARFRRS